MEKDLKKKKSRAVIIGTICTLTLTTVLGASIVLSELNLSKEAKIKDPISKKATKFVEEYLDNDSNLLSQSQALNIYESMHKTAGVGEEISFVKHGVILEHSYDDSGVKEASNIKEEVTFEQFKNSIINIENAGPFLGTRLPYIPRTEEEQKAFNLKIARDYGIVIKYVETHMNKDNSEFLKGTFAVIMDTLYNKNVKNQIEINSIIPASDSTISIEATVNGQSMIFTTDNPEYYNLISIASLKMEGSFLEDLKDATSALMNTAMLTGQNQIVKKEDNFAENFMCFILGGIAIVVAAGIISSKDKQKTNKK